MNSLRIIALLAFSLLTITGEAALSRGDAAPLIIVAADQLVDYTFNVQGIDAATSVAFFLYEENFWDEAEYDYFVSNPRSGIELDIKDGVATYSERYSKNGVPEANNIYYQLIVDGGKMVGRMGESSNFAFVDLGPVDDPEEHIRHAYTATATIDFVAGHIAPYHTGPDPIPEPTNGLLLLVGSALLLIRRRRP